MKIMKYLKFWPFNKEQRATIGRLEYVSIPELGLFNVSAKIDTGAYRGSIHAENIEEIEEGGVKKLSFHVLDSEHPEDATKKHVVGDYKKVRVRNTDSPYKDRFAIPVMVELGNKSLEVELTLSNRKELRHPILLGRKYIKCHFIIDPGEKNIHGYPKGENNIKI
jgi:hypothetical protein